MSDVGEPTAGRDTTAGYGSDEGPARPDAVDAVAQADAAGTGGAAPPSDAAEEPEEDQRPLG